MTSKYGEIKKENPKKNDKLVSKYLNFDWQSYWQAIEAVKKSVREMNR
jgi:hypothetical protein